MLRIWSTSMNMNVSLPEELAEFVKAKVSSGRYTSSSEVVREALRLLEQQDIKNAEELRWLQMAWQEGLDSGDAGELDVESLKREARQRMASVRGAWAVSGIPTNPAPT
jgi:antitoxin ParD1/3/4